MFEMTCPRPCDWSVPIYVSFDAGQRASRHLPSRSTTMVGVCPPNDMLAELKQKEPQVQYTGNTESRGKSGQWCSGYRGAMRSRGVVPRRRAHKNY
jgi:hypothetical protein